MCDCRKGDGSGGDGFKDLDLYGCMGIGGSPQSFGRGVAGPVNSFSNESNSIHLMDCLLRT